MRIVVFEYKSISQLTLSSNDEKLQNQSNSCDDLVSMLTTVVWFQQNLTNPAFVPACRGQKTPLTTQKKIKYEIYNARIPTCRSDRSLKISILSGSILRAFL